ncbi:hypothetical protein [Undibacterium fentianense]|uniref:Uncharacterized protein n=1 Tax=Undibacterium fentianense TaxID=2828728 RepID=A0A941IFJ4_9BURK|nr:hypothetical protein [Undibacterium fentianense]MBR7799095.1 hypothetical protein [Undibacterium fentianense]
MTLLHLTAPQEFQFSSITQHLVAAISAIAMTALFLIQLNLNFVRPSAVTRFNMQLFNISLPKTIEPSVAEIPPKKLVDNKIQKVDSGKRIKKTETASTPPPTSHDSSNTPTPTDTTARLDSPFDTAGSANTFKPDGATVRDAYHASKSDIQKMAEKRGLALNDPKASKYEKFQDAATRAAKPDCLRQGGSILSLFVVAYQVATDHCK